jgi:hypothetical protein
MTITLKPEYEQVIEQAIQAGIIERADQVVEVGLDALRGCLEKRAASSAPMTAEEWKRKLHKWIASHSASTPLLSDEAISRESIYRDRGL